MDGYILVVDDDPAMRAMICATLDFLEYDTKEAANGLEALRLIAAEQPAAIVLDLMMPVMDGFTTLARIFRNKKTRYIPVIVLSAVADRSKQLLRFPGVKGILQKGHYSLKEFEGMIRSAVRDMVAV